jgi:flagellar basal body rod protein FlgG
MSNAAEIALSAIRALDRANDVIANNIANVNTGGFQKSRAATEQAAAGGVTLTVEQLNLPIDTVTLAGERQKVPETSDVQLDEELIALTVNKHSFEANIQALKTTEEMQGTLFDLFG